MVQQEHSKIISRVAKQIFSPYGMSRKGQSRTWLDDRGWFTIIIEFQPSAGSKGTYLNVGVSFHWYLQDHWSFDFGGSRESHFVEFENENQFTPKVEVMAKLALDKALLYREQLKSIDSAKQAIIKYSFASDELWGNYHKGVICGLSGDKDSAAKYFKALLAVDHKVEWADELKERTLLLKGLLDENEKFRQSIFSTIAETRKLKKLKGIDISLGSI